METDGSPGLERVHTVVTKESTSRRSGDRYKRSGYRSVVQLPVSHWLIVLCLLFLALIIEGCKLRQCNTNSAWPIVYLFLGHGLNSQCVLWKREENPFQFFDKTNKWFVHTTYFCQKFYLKCMLCWRIICWYYSQPTQRGMSSLKASLRFKSSVLRYLWTCIRIWRFGWLCIVVQFFY